MTDKQDIMVDKLNRIEANTAATKADTAALRIAIDKAVELLELSTRQHSLDPKESKFLGGEYGSESEAFYAFLTIMERAPRPWERDFVMSRIRAK